MASRNRGVKRPKLRDLSQKPLTTEEQFALLDAIDLAAPPIAIAILGAVLVEHELETSLRRRLSRKDDDTWEEMLAETGPLSTFARKITAGHAMRLFDEALSTNLNIVRTIRNAFAHSKRLIDFDHPLVAAELKKIEIPKSRKKTFQRLRTGAPKLAYVGLCLALSSEMIKRRARSSNAVHQRKIRTSPLYRAIAPTLGMGSIYGISGLSKADLVSNRLRTPASESADASRGVPSGYAAMLLPFLEEN